MIKRLNSQMRKLKSTQRVKLRNLAFAIFFFSLALGVGNYAISSSNHTDKYLVASRDLPAGSSLNTGDAKISEANLGGSKDQYLLEGQFPSGAYLLGPLREGQLIPMSMVASSVLDERVPVVIESAMGLPNGLVAGASVDIWVSPLEENQIYGEPYAIVLGAEVAQLLESNEVFANQDPSVEIWVPIDAVGPVLNSISSGDQISLILRPTLADG